MASTVAILNTMTVDALLENIRFIKTAPNPELFADFRQLLIDIVYKRIEDKDAVRAATPEVRAATPEAPAPEAPAAISLREFGYALKAQTELRQAALLRAVESAGATAVVSRLTQLSEFWTDNLDYTRAIKADLAFVQPLAALEEPEAAAAAAAPPARVLDNLTDFGYYISQPAEVRRGAITAAIRLTSREQVIERLETLSQALKNDNNLMGYTAILNDIAFIKSDAIIPRIPDCGLFRDYDYAASAADRYKVLDTSMMLYGTDNVVAYLNLKAQKAYLPIARITIDKDIRYCLNRKA